MKTRLNLHIPWQWAIFIFLLNIVLPNLPIFPYTAAVTQAANSTALIATTSRLKPYDAPESYGPDTLWEKINGQAEFYLPAGFKSLQSQMYVHSDNDDMLIEVNIFNMGNLANAFSVFSLQKREAAHPIDGIPLGYQTKNAVYLVHGPFYVEIISMMPMGKRMVLLNQLAQQFIKDTPVQSADMDELNVFPKENQIQGSTALIPKDAFGFDGLDKVYTMAYQMGPDEVIAFISKRQSQADAEKLANGLYAYFMDFGAHDIKQNTAIKGARMIEIMGTYELMFSVNNYFAGVHEAPTQKQAEKLAQMLAESLQK